MNYNQGKSSGEAYSGLRGTPYFDDATRNSYASGQNLTDIATKASKDMTQYNGQTGSQLLPGGQYGLGSNADAAVQQFGKYMFGQASGSAGARGQLSPENLAGVTGSAVSQSLPTLMPYIQQWQLAQFQAPQGLNQAAISAAQAPANYWASTLGVQQQNQQSNFGFGVDPNKAQLAAIGGIFGA